MTKANVFKMIISMTKAMMYEYDVMHVSLSSVCDENYEPNDGNCVKTISENIRINDGLWHIEYDERGTSIWFYETIINSDGKATGYMPRYWIDISNLKQYDICGEIGYYLMKIKYDIKMRG